MNSEIAEDFNYIDSALEVWNELTGRYGHSNRPLIYQMKKELDSLRQENQTVVSYYNKLRKLWDELCSVRAIPTCFCGVLCNHCTCNFLKRLSDFENEEKLIRFLLGLNSGFNSTITNILSMSPLPSLNRAYYLANQIEKQQQISGNNDVVQEASALAVQNTSKFRGSNSDSKPSWRRDKADKASRFCDHCKKQGHTIDQCFKLIGEPDWYASLKNSKPNSSCSNVRSAHVVVHNDASDDDNPLDFSGPMFNSGVSSGTTSSGSQSLDPTLFNTVYQEVLKALQTKSPSSTGRDKSAVAYTSFVGVVEPVACQAISHNDSWIVDSGATDHITFDSSILFDSYIPASPIHLHLPNGSMKSVSLVGKVHLTSSIVLDKVLLVKDFTHNLISVGKFIDQTGYGVQFTSNKCFFHKLKSMKVLSIGRRNGGLYFLKKAFNPSAISTAAWSDHDNTLSPYVS